MSEIETIVELLQNSYNGSPWHGPSLVGNLDGITAEQAARKAIPNAHSVWEIVQHVTAWINEVIKTLDGEQYEVLTPEQDWPAIASGDDAAWESALSILDSSHEALCGAAGEMQDDKLWEKVEGQDFDYYWMLLGVVQHSVYHAGQVGLLRKSICP